MKGRSRFLGRLWGNKHITFCKYYSILSGEAEYTSTSQNRPSAAAALLGKRILFVLSESWWCKVVFLKKWAFAVKCFVLSNANAFPGAKIRTAIHQFYWGQAKVADFFNPNNLAGHILWGIWNSVWFWYLNAVCYLTVILFPSTKRIIANSCAPIHSITGDSDFKTSDTVMVVNQWYDEEKQQILGEGNNILFQIFAPPFLH